MAHETMMVSLSKVHLQDLEVEYALLKVEVEEMNPPLQ